VWARRFGEPPATPQERARQARFLQSRGFSAETIGKVLRGLPGGD
jgi:regulatory protein